MAKPVILAVDDDPEVLGAVERDLKQRYRADYRVLPARSGRQAIETARGAEAPRYARCALPGRSAHAGHDRHPVPAEDADAAPRCETRAADRVRRFGSGHCGDQRGGAGPLPDEAVGSARTAPVSGARRPAGRLVGARPHSLRWRPHRRLAVVAAELRDARLPVAQPDPVPVDRRRIGRVDAAARRRHHRRRPGAAAARPAGRRHGAGDAVARGAGRKGRPADRAHASLLRPGRRSAAAPPAWRARSTARPKD